MAIPPTKGGGPSSPSSWESGEIPPGPPLPMDNVWTKFAMAIFKNFGAEAAKYAAPLEKVMMQMLNNTMKKIEEGRRRANDYMKQVIKGQE